MSVDLIDPHEAMDARISTDARSLGSSTVEIPPHPPTFQKTELKNASG
jgi:hypothetical protein